MTVVGIMWAIGFGLFIGGSYYFVKARQAREKLKRRMGRGNETTEYVSFL